MIMRALLGAALTVLVASAGEAQQPAEPPASPSTMDCMMHSMQGEQTQGMQAGMGMHTQGAPGGGMGMHGMQPDGAATPSMACDCAGCATRAGFAALLGGGAGALTLTNEQTSDLDAIMGRAREAALAVLTAEQRAALEAQSAGPAGGCMNAQSSEAVEHQH